MAGQPPPNVNERWAVVPRAETSRLYEKGRIGSGLR